MVSKITALYDWKQAAERKLDRYNDFASLLSYNSLTLLFNKHSTDINEPSFQRSLVNSLLTSGIAMEIAGSSRPASGSEHLISHGLDAVSRRPRMHGLQVGVATYLCALLQNNPSTAMSGISCQLPAFSIMSSRILCQRKTLSMHCKWHPELKPIITPY